MDEVRVIVGALSGVPVDQKCLLICEKDMHVERREEIEVVHVTEGSSVKDMLLACDPGTAVEV